FETNRSCMNPRSNEKPFLRSQLRATRALIKFCDDHGYDVGGVAELRTCQKALEKGDLERAIESYRKIPIGGMGCFNDWLPPAVFSHETAEYSQAVFEALVAQWSMLMQLSLPK